MTEILNSARVSAFRDFLRVINKTLITREKKSPILGEERMAILSSFLSE